MKRILVIFSHPALQSSRANKQLLQAIDGLEGVTLHDLYHHYPDMFINVKREQALLSEHDIIVFQHPFYWYSCPAIMKEWMDLVLEYGYAYGPEAHALKGKQWLSAITTGGAPESYCSEGYNSRPLLDFLLPFQQTATLCGMHWLPPFVLHSFHKIRDPEALRRCGQDYRQLLCALRDEQLTPEQLAGRPYLRDLLEELYDTNSIRSLPRHALPGICHRVEDPLMGHGLLFDAFIYLSAAVIAVPLAKRWGLGSVLGYLLAGIIIGPFLLGLVGEQKDVMHFAEFGVVLMLFLVGLELRPALLWQLKGPILGTGGLQVLLTTGALTGVAYLIGLPLQQGLAIGLILALSSTAIVLQSLQERKLMQSESGRSAFAVLLFQDIAVIPILAILPLLAIAPVASNGSTELAGWQHGLLVVAAISGIVLGGHYLMRPVFRAIAQSHMREIFVAAALLLVIAIAVLMESVGLSPALGSFLAGVVLADSEYRHELEADIEPFKGLLLGLFFMSVGAGIDFGLFAEHPFLIPTLVIGLMVLKWLVLMALGFAIRISPGQRWTFALALAQGGEFAFVLFSFAAQNRVLPGDTISLLTLVVALSMALTPLLLILNDRVIQPWFDYRNQGDVPQHEQPELVEHPVIIAGFGRFGQIVGRLLHGHGIGTTILEQDASQIEMLRKYGYQVFYGDASRIDLLHAAGAHKAKLLVLSINDTATSLAVIEMARKHFPHLKILARAQDRPHAHEILRHGVDSVYRETLGSAVDLGVEALTQLGFRANQAWRAGQTFKQHDNWLLREQVNYLDDEHTYINKSLQYREILSDLLQDDEEGQERIHAHNWNSGLPNDDKEAR